MHLFKKRYRLRKMPSYPDVLRHNLRQLLIALDQLVNALMGVLSFSRDYYYADETLSAHSFRWAISGVRQWPRNLIDKVAGWLGDEDHCYQSYLSEREGRQLPPELRPK